MTIQHHPIGTTVRSKNRASRFAQSDLTMTIIDPDLDPMTKGDRRRDNNDLVRVQRGNETPARWWLNPADLDVVEHALYPVGTKVRYTGNVILALKGRDAVVVEITGTEKAPEGMNLVARASSAGNSRWWVGPNELVPVEDTHEFSVADIHLLQRAIENDSSTDRHEARMLLNAKLHPTTSHTFTVTIEAADNYEIGAPYLQQTIAANPHFTKVTVEPLTASTEGASA